MNSLSLQEVADLTGGDILTGSPALRITGIATDSREIREGDLFFALVNLARWKKVDAESALREMNLRFKERFSYIEAGARGQGRKMQDLSLDEMESLWQEAKKK